MAEITNKDELKEAWKEVLADLKAVQEDPTLAPGFIEGLTDWTFPEGFKTEGVETGFIVTLPDGSELFLSCEDWPKTN